MAERRGPIRKFPIGPIYRALGGECGDYRTGKQKVLCIFHDDRRPSASIDFSANRFICWACGVGGDALDLIVHQEGVSLSAAIDRAEGIVGSEPAPVRSREPEAPSLFGRPRAGRSNR